MNFSHPHFAEPAWLWLAFAGPIALFLLQRYSAWKRHRQLEQVAAPAFLKELTRSHSPFRRGVKEVLLLIAVLGFGLALARPQWGEQAETSRLLGQDVVFVLDCSRSMLATDIAPSRLQRAKLAIADYARRYGRGRFGLVAFAGEAFVQCPLTWDYGAFEDALNAVDDRLIPVPGTNLGRALEEGAAALDKKARLKVLVLLTDGEDLERSAIETAETLGRDGVVVYTIGVGTLAGAEVRFINDKGQPELVQDLDGEVVRSRLDESTLRVIAQSTRGAYFPLGPLGEGLAKVRLSFDMMTTVPSDSPGRKLGVDRFHLPVAAALLLLVGESLMSTRRRRPDSQLGA